MMSAVLLVSPDLELSMGNNKKRHWVLAYTSQQTLGRSIMQRTKKQQVPYQCTGCKHGMIF